MTTITYAELKIWKVMLDGKAVGDIRYTVDKGYFYRPDAGLLGQEPEYFGSLEGCKAHLEGTD